MAEVDLAVVKLSLFSNCQRRPRAKVYKYNHREIISRSFTFL